MDFSFRGTTIRRCCSAFAVAVVVTSAASGQGPVVFRNAQQFERRHAVAFVANQGQAPADVLFEAEGAAFRASFARDRFVLRVFTARSEAPAPAAGASAGPPADRFRSAPVDVTEQRVTLVGANPQVALEPLDAQPGKLNYFHGNDPQRWLRGLTTYARLRYRNIYPGIDLLFYENRGTLEYDFVVSAGTDPNLIRLRVDGPGPAHITARGELQVGEGAEALLHRPLLYQNLENGKRVIEGRFVALGENTVGFRFSKYDTAKTLVIDPTLNLLYSTYLGGLHDDTSSGIVLDAQNNAYLLGASASEDYAISGNAFQSVRKQLGVYAYDLVVTKFSPSGVLVYSTFLGGTADEASGSAGIAVDSLGNAYVSGQTKSNDYPVTANGYQTTYPAGALQSGILSELSPDGSALVYSTYFSGTGGSNTNGGIALSQGKVYVTGSAGPGLPTTTGAYMRQLTAGSAAFVAIFDLTQTGAAQLVASTYYGTSNPVQNSVGTGNLSFAMALDHTNNVWITGQTYTNNLPLTANALQPAWPAVTPSCQGGGVPLNSAVYVAKLSANLTSLMYASYLSGKTTGAQVNACSEFARSLALDANDNVYITGTTASASFPVKAGVLQGSYPGGSGFVGFVAELSADGTTLVWGSYLGGNAGYTFPVQLGLDHLGHVWVGGTTQGGTNFPITPGAYQTTEKGGYDAHLTELSADGTQLLYGTYLGGGGDDSIQSLAFDALNNIYVTGDTTSANFPVTANAFQSVIADGDAFYDRNDIFFAMFGAGVIGAISPTSVGNSGDTTVTINGAGFQAGTTCALEMAGTTIQAATTSVSPDGTNLTCTFALNGAATGSYDVVVTNPGGTPFVKPAALTVANGGSAQLWATVVGRPKIRTGQPSVFYVTYGNSGTTTAYFPTIWVAVPNNFQFSMPAGVTDALNPGVPITDQGAAFLDDSDASTKIPFTIPVLPPGATGSVQLQLADPTDNDQYTLAAYAQPGWFTSYQDATASLTALNQASAPVSPECQAPQSPQGCLNFWADYTARQVLSLVIQIENQITQSSANGTTYSVIPDQVILAVEQSFALGAANELVFATQGTHLTPPTPFAPAGAHSSRRVAGVQPKASPWGIDLGNGNFYQFSQPLEGPPPPPTPVEVPAVAPEVAPTAAAPAAATGFSAVPILTGAIIVAEGYLISKEIDYFLNVALHQDLCSLLGKGQDTGQDPHVELSPCQGGTQVLTVTFFCTGGLIQETQTHECLPPNPCKNGKGGGNCQGGGSGQSIDPNDKGGTGGDGSSSHYVKLSTPLAYSVGFENVATASLPASQVVITDQLDPLKVDLSTLTLGTVAFGTNVISLPSGASSFNTTYGINSSMSARIQGSLDSNTGLLKWTFTTIDPATGLPPSDPTIGFLPPDTDGIKGQGSVVFTVMPKSGLSSGTQISNQATVVFDVNPPIVTPVWVNTIDVDLPTSSVQALPATEPQVVFNVSWSGTDNSSGIGTYSIYVSDNNGPYAAWQSAVTTTSAAYNGQPGHTYRFYSLATDKVGNAQPPKQAPDTTTTVSSTATPFMLNPPSANLPATAGSTTAGVVAPSSGAAWTAASNDPWITITSGASGTGNGTVSYSVAANGGVQRVGTMTIAGLTFTITQAGAITTNGLGFYPVTPCRVVDTRTGFGFQNQFGPPQMSANATRAFPITQSSCGIPPTARAYSLNVTVVPAVTLTYLTIWPDGQQQPLVSTLNSFDGAVVANAAIVPAGQNGSIDVFVSDATDVIIDINGYFAPPDASALAFYPLTPCRVADTRAGFGFTNPFGPPQMTAGQTREFPISLSTCGVPPGARAYSLNMTVVPPGPLIYLSTWPSQRSQPVVSTLNAFDGRVAANAAIVPAGPDGGINVFVSDPSDVLIDINGYFAPPGQGALYFYPATPCRVADTRTGFGFTNPFGPPPMGSRESRDFPITSSGCSIPGSAQAYSLNMTVVPPGPLIYLTTWPKGVTQPVVSTLNSFQGKVVANAAIVPAGQGGAISVFVSDPTNLIIDINGYFAQ